MTNLTPDNIAPADPLKLYSPKRIVVAAFPGSPIAGGITMAENFRAFGNDSQSKTTIQISIAATVVVFILTFYLPEKTPNSILRAACYGAYLWFANKYQLKRFERHIEAGGPKQSNWRVAGIGIACLVGVSVALFALILIFPDWFPE